LEPSITILNAIAPFIQSVFVRVRGHGALAFQTFWRATYHSRLDIPKKDYPLLIQTCLKAWADFCEDSLADGISIDSLSTDVRGHIPLTFGLFFNTHLWLVLID